MQIKGYYTGKKINALIIENEKEVDKEVTIGKISGYNGTGIPVYDLLGHNNEKVGELQNTFIKQKLKK